MFFNYIKVTLRSLRRDRTYSMINILGLAIGFACFSLIAVYIKNEQSYESFNPRADGVYRMVGILTEAGLGEYYNAITPGPLARALEAEIPQVEAATRARWLGSALVSMGDKAVYQDGLMYADPSAFDVLAVHLISGDKTTALKAPYSIVIDQETRQKYFGNEDPMGKHLTVAEGGGTKAYAVTGVIENYPKNSHLGFSALVSFSTAEENSTFMKNWGTNCLSTYVLLKPGTRKSDVEGQMPRFVDRHVDHDEGTKKQYYLQPLTDIHLHSGHILYQMNQSAGSGTLLQMFAAIGVFVLLIGSINYMNLSTARSMKRSKEVGVRKVLGSQRKHLVSRFMGESIATAFLGLLLSFIIVELFYPGFKSIMKDRLLFDYHHEPVYILQLVAISIIVGVASGLYPAALLSSYQPSDTLRGALTRGRRGAVLRKGLVFLQFGIAIILLVCTGIVRDQMQFIQNSDIGFDKSQVMYVPMRNAEARSKYLVMKEEIGRHAAVQEVSGGEGIAGAGGSDGTMVVAGTNKKLKTMMRFSPVDYDFFRTMGISFVQGRDFSRAIASDSSTGVIVNEATLRELGWRDAIGKQFEQESGPPVNVIGVVRDYHYFSLYTKIEPQMLYISRDRLLFMLVKLRAGMVDQGIGAVEKIWKQQLPGQPFDYGFVDEAVDRQYRSSQTTQTLFTGFSIIAVIVGCLGLFGLSVFTAEQRTKEIGIRKVLGASISSLAMKLSSEFVKLVALSSLVAFPVAYWAMQEWLQNFAYRAAINPLTFVFAAVLVLLIALVTVSIQSVRVALANPVEALRYE